MIEKKLQEQQVDIAREKLNEILNYLHSQTFNTIDDFVMLDEMYDILIKARNNNLKGAW